MNRLALAFILSASTFVGCHDDEDGHIHFYHTHGSSDGFTTYSSHNVNPVWLYNAQHYYGQTLRWPSVAVYIDIRNNSVDQNLVQSVISELNSYIYPARLEIWNGGSSNVTASINLTHDPFRNSCGIVNFDIINFPFISNVTVIVGNCGPGGLRASVKHLLIHAVGFFGHTAEGGVMDAQAYNESITSSVASALIGLYSLPAGTEVYP